MSRWLRWTVTVVLTLDILVALAFLGSEVLETRASTASPAAGAVKAQPEASAKAATPAEPAPVEPKPAAADDPPPADTIPGAGPDEPAAQPAFDATKSDAFGRLLRTYENMEPESAAKALAELASRDRRAVVELVLGSKPRTSGAILDALTQTHAGLAADLSYEIWKRAGNQAQESGAGRP